jgi:hypothetical protein
MHQTKEKNRTIHLVFYSVENAPNKRKRGKFIWCFILLRMHLTKERDRTIHLVFYSVDHVSKENR